MEKTESKLLNKYLIVVESWRQDEHWPKNPSSSEESIKNCMHWYDIFYKEQKRSFEIYKVSLVKKG